MKKPLFILVAILIFTNGCVPSSPANTPTARATDTPVRVSSASPPASQTPHPATETPPTFTKNARTPTPTPTVALQSVNILNGNIPECNSVASNTNLLIPGGILYQKYEYKGLFAFSRSPSLMVNTIIPESQRIHVFGVSPNGKWVAYTPVLGTPEQILEQIDPTIVLMGADGEKIEQTVNMDWAREKNRSKHYLLVDFISGYWINDHQIFTYVNSKMSLNTPTPLLSSEIGLFHPFVFDPFEGSVQTDLLQLLSANGFTGYAISPGGKHFLYDGSGVILKEISEDGLTNVIWRSPPGQLWPFDPFGWSPNGEWVIFQLVSGENGASNGVRTILVSKDGKIALDLRASKFQEAHKKIYWSPDSKHLAFVLHDNNTYQLVVFNLAERKFILECSQQTKSNFLHSGLIWSPDSEWIAVSQYEEPVWVVNIGTRQATSLDIVGDVVGWSSAFQAHP